MSLRDRLFITANQLKDNIAYTYLGKERTYKELAQDVEFMAAALKKRGIKQGDKLALLLPNCEEFVITYYAIISLGGAVVPINPTYTPHEITYILMDAGVSGVITLGPIAAGFLKMTEDYPQIKDLLILTTTPIQGLETVSDLLTEKLTVESWPILDEDDVAVILYTSGTTGKPKGAMLTHKNLESNAVSTGKHVDFQPEDVVLCVLPLFHVFCMTVCMNMPIIHGSKMVILPRFTPGEAIKAVKDEKVSVFVAVPTMYSMILNYSAATQEDFHSVKYCISGGAALPVELLEQFESSFAVMILEGYGLSEASPVSAVNPRFATRKAGSIGVTIPGVRMKIVNENGKELPPGQIGEIVIKGPNIMKGYFNNPEATSEAIKEGWLHTGDLAYQDEEGYFFIVDRKKDMIIVGGFNVYPREVEEVLYRVPQLEEVAVVGKPDPVFGESVVVYAKIKANQNISEEDVIEFSKKNLAKYKVPKEVVFLEELPKNSTGKILRRELKNF